MLKKMAPYIAVLIKNQTAVSEQDIEQSSLSDNSEVKAVAIPSESVQNAIQQSQRNDKMYQRQSF